MKNKFLFSVFVSFIVLVLISLGSWQLYRLNWKLNLISEINNSLEHDPVELSKSDKKNYLRIRTSGKIDFDKQIYLYNSMWSILHLNIETRTQDGMDIHGFSNRK